LPAAALQKGIKMNEEYLGDGLYASYDGFMITLRAPRTGGDHWVGLEPEILAAFLQWAESVKAIKPKGKIDP
jgi:hypothetical protein